MYKILDKVNTPQDLRKLDVSELPGLCDEIRDYIVRCCASNPGHLASSLGAVELIVGTHYVFDTPSDKVVFDVGHQAYAHKIITDRKEAFRNNRRKDGISGFPNRDESTYDAFGAGHASTSISAALGLAKAAQLTGSGEKVVAMIGDGSMTGGLALEGLNNAGDSDTDLLVILNDNDMAIDGSRGAMHSYLLKITTDPAYNRLKTHVWNKLGSSNFRNWLQRVIRNTKSGLVNKSGGDIFEAFGFRYFGPIDGNNVALVVQTLKRLKDIKGPKILHTCTVKGKGYAPAEADPTTWHAPGKFDPETGERKSAVQVPSTGSGSGRVRYQDVFGEVLCELARKDPKVVGITPAMATGSGMTAFAEEFPERFFDVGIAEEHAATFAAGLAAGGMKPYCSIYSTFAQRAYDEIVHDVALQHLPVVFCFDRAGLVGQDGATHHGAFDLAALRPIPNLTISSPMNEHELRKLMYTAQLPDKGPFVIRYPRGRGVLTDWQCPFEELPVGKGRKLSEGKDVAVLSLGPIGNVVAKAVQDLKEEEGLSVAHYDMRFLKPIDGEILQEVGTAFRRIVTVEDGAVQGGLGSAVIEYMSDHNLHPEVIRLGLPDHFVEHGTPDELYHLVGLDAENIKLRIKS